MPDGLRAFEGGDEFIAIARTIRTSRQWNHKLEGLPDSAWEPEIEAARQEYKLLATSAVSSALAKQSGDDLEAAIRLARMDPAELYGLPIPSQ